MNPKGWLNPSVSAALDSRPRKQHPQRRFIRSSVFPSRFQDIILMKTLSGELPQVANKSTWLSLIPKFCAQSPWSVVLLHLTNNSVEQLLSRISRHQSELLTVSINERQTHKCLRRGSYFLTFGDGPLGVSVVWLPDVRL